MSSRRDAFSWPAEIPAPGGGLARLIDDPDASTRRRLPSDAPPSAPAYRLAGGAVGVATGRLFVVFDSTGAAASDVATLEGLRLKLVERPAYAPRAAFVADVDGDGAACLRRAADLRRSPGVVSVEAELLRPRVSR
jgi:hypothetical protein